MKLKHEKVFITGVTGLLGANVVIKLLENGYYVIALVRKKSKYLGEENKNLKLVEGSLFSDFSDYMENIDFIIHIAAETRQNLLDYKEYKKINFDVTVHLFSYAKKVEKFIFVGTANTLGFGSPIHPGDETSQWKYPFSESMYAKSKYETENFLLQSNIPVIILNPTFMIGSYDNKPSSGKILYWIWNKKFAFYPKGGKNFVNAEDVANGILKVLVQGKVGEKYLLAHENLSYKEFFQKVKTITNQKTLLLPIPNFVLILLGYFGDFLRYMKIKTSLSSVNMKALRINNYYSNHKSVDQLDVQYQSIEKGIREALEYFDNKK